MASNPHELFEGERKSNSEGLGDAWSDDVQATSANANNGTSFTEIPEDLMREMIDNFNAETRYEDFEEQAFPTLTNLGIGNLDSFTDFSMFEEIYSTEQSAVANDTIVPGAHQGLSQQMQVAPSQALFFQHDSETPKRLSHKRKANLLVTAKKPKPIDVTSTNDNHSETSSSSSSSIKKEAPQVDELFYEETNALRKDALRIITAWKQLLAKLLTIPYALNVPAVANNYRAVLRNNAGFKFPRQQFTGTKISSHEPRVFSNVKSYFHRNAENIKHYYKTATTFLASPLQEKYSYAACAILLANEHHLYEIACQPYFSKPSIITYLLARYEKDIAGSISVPDRENMVKTLRTEIGKIVSKMRTKRIHYNRTAFPLDYIHEPSNMSAFNVIEVEIRELNTLSQQGKAMKTFVAPKDYTSFRNNTIIIDKTSKKILAIMLSNPFALNAEMTALIQKMQHHKCWEHNSRSTSLKKPKVLEEHHHTNKGGQITLGVLNFAKKGGANYSQVTGQFPETRRLWKIIKDKVHNEVLELYQKYLPKTYAAATEITRELRDVGYLMSDASPFSAVSLNKGNEVSAHRDLNVHSYSAMLVFDLENKPTNAGTCFVEWIDPTTGNPVEFIVPHNGVLIADTDYLHLVRNACPTRMSMVFYAYKDLTIPSQLFCYDSDMEDSGLNICKLPDAERKELREQTEIAAVNISPILQFSAQAAAGSKAPAMDKIQIDQQRQLPASEEIDEPGAKRVKMEKL